METTQVKVSNVIEAVELAEKFKKDGSHNWFRGQIDNWLVKTTLARLDKSLRESAIEKLERFYDWVKTTKGLEYIGENIDATMAVAQHYGLPTNYVDFSTEPKVAGFFASDYDKPLDDKLSCIICLNTGNLERFWLAMPQNYPPPGFIKLNVPDLWRLDAQYGCFLYLPYDEFEKIYHFDRILFPKTNIALEIKKEDVYPKRKSNLEILLGQYFMTERLIEGTKRFENNTNVISIPYSEWSKDIYPNGIPEHSSWSPGNLEPWMLSPKEDFFETNTSTNVATEIRVDNIDSLLDLPAKIQEQILEVFHKQPDIRNKLPNWTLHVKQDDSLSYENISHLINGYLNNLWDGLRFLPHSNNDIAYGLGMCIAYVLALKGDFRNPDSRHWEGAANKCLNGPIEIEFGSIDGSYSRGFVSSNSLLDAVRPDLLNYVGETWKEKFKVIRLGLFKHQGIREELLISICSLQYLQRKLRRSR